MRVALKRMSETEEERQLRRMKDRLRKSQRRSMESEEERRVRLEADRLRAAGKRMMMKYKIQDREGSSLLLEDFGEVTAESNDVEMDERSAEDGAEGSV